MTTNTVNHGYVRAIGMLPPDDATGLSGDEQVQVQGSWFLQFAAIQLKMKQMDVQDVLSATQQQMTLQQALIDAEKAFNAFPDGMDARKDGADGDNGKEADNAKNVANAQAFNAKIDAAINELPADSPYRAKLEAMKIPIGDKSSFIFDAQKMHDLKANFDGLKKSVDNESDMKMFLAKQAIDDQSQLVATLSGVQESINRSLQQLAEKVGS